jgi:ribosomal protein S18 acetylase RimI-like enzyme
MDRAEAAATAAAIDGGDGRVVLIAADEGGMRLGFVHLETYVDFFTRERHGHISTLVVSPEAEGHGVGRALLAAAEAWCTGRGYRFLTLNVFNGNTAARRLYDRAGFGIDTIKYLKQLS